MKFPSSDLKCFRLKVLLNKGEKESSIPLSYEIGERREEKRGYYIKSLI